MFHFPGLSRKRYLLQFPKGISAYVSRFVTAKGFPIQRSPDQRLLAPPRSVSSLATSFIDFWRQGIHHALLVT